MDNILDIMGGIDGGIGFVNLKLFLEDLNNKEDEASKEILKAFKLVDNTCLYFLNKKLGVIV